MTISDVWTWSVPGLASRLASLSAADHAPAIHAMLHDNYEATPLFSDPAIGTYYGLRRMAP